MELKELIAECGFEPIGCFDATQLEVRPEVRDMCATDKCQAYNKNWMCPPAVGNVEDFQEQFKEYQIGYVFQTVAEMEDPFDFMGIQEGSREHTRRIRILAEKVEALNKPPLILGAGACAICDSCTYPDAPCQHPDKAFPSMEATGLVIADVCTLAEIPYYHGKGTLAFCSCALQ